MTLRILFLSLLLSQIVHGDILDGYLDRWSFPSGGSATAFVNSSVADPNASFPIRDVNNSIVGSVSGSVTPQSISTAEPWKDGYGYQPSFSFTVPSLASGLYSIGADRQPDTRYSGTMPFIVKDPDKTSDIVILQYTNTTNAYNNNGGKSFYRPNSTDNIRSNTVSFRRPQDAEEWGGIGGDYSLQFNQWMTTQTDLDYRYISDADMNDYSELSGSELLIVTGHSEYWTREARQNFDRFVDEGGSVLYMTGGSMWWEVEYDDPLNPTTMSKLGDGSGAQSRFHNLGYPPEDSIGASWEYGGLGKNIHGSPGWEGFKLTSIPTYLEGLGVSLGDIISVPTVEYDGIEILGFDSTTGEPIIDTSDYSFIDVVGFDLTRNTFDFEFGNGTWFEYQDSPTSGRVINVPSTDWTGRAILGEDGPIITQATRNMIDYLLVQQAQVPEPSCHWILAALPLLWASRSSRRRHG